MRTTSKRTETSLQSTISALKKSVDKGIKEDQRGRTRILTLEEAIRKAADGEREGEGEGKRCEGLIAELVLREGEARRELTLRKEGKSTSIAVPVARVEEPEVQEPNEEEEEHELADGIADLARELAALNKAIETVDLARAKEVFKGMEGEIGRIEGELNSFVSPSPHHGLTGSQHRPGRSVSSFAHSGPPERGCSVSRGLLSSRTETSARAHPLRLPRCAQVASRAEHRSHLWQVLFPSRGGCRRERVSEQRVGGGSRGRGREKDHAAAVRQGASGDVAPLCAGQCELLARPAGRGRETTIGESHPGRLRDDRVPCELGTALELDAQDQVLHEHGRVGAGTVQHSRILNLLKSITSSLRAPS